MYCKLFSSLYQGTLRGKSHEILVFTNLLAHCDAHGYVDKHWKAISDEVGLTIEEVKEAITFLEAPDPESRSHDHDGARIIKMDGHRAWGWQVVNYEKYRAIRDEEDRREQNRLAQQRFREKHKPSSAIVSHGKPPSSEGEGEGEGEENKAAVFSLNQKQPFKSPSKLLRSWSVAFERSLNFPYVPVDFKDEKAVTKITGLRDFDEAIFLDTARKAWESKRFYCQKSLTLHGFVENFNNIRGELGLLKTKESSWKKDVVNP